MLLVLCGNVAKAQSYQSFDANKNYTKILIDAKINDFAGNTKPMGFGSYNSETDVIIQPQWKTDISNGSNRDLAMDYVAGLVAKACIEAADYYKDFTWSKPWFKLVENYATKVTVPTTGASLDDLNASKMYFALAELTKSGAKYENSTTYNRAITELNNALTGLKAVNDNYSIRSGSTVNYYSDGKKQTFNLVDADRNELSPATSGMNAIGGWYHKATYPNEMWCDSEYMGPALLAQLVAYAANNTSAGIGTITGSTAGDWKLIAKQFDITWNYLWNSTDELLYHGFSATPKAVGAHTYTWATGTNGTNTAYWGRAIAWYFLALVDVLENMPDNISDNSYTSTQDNLISRNANIKTRLKSYLTDLAAGIWKWRKTDSNLWTNVINEAVDKEHTSYSTTSAVIQKNTKNYLEASASAIYIATYLKAMRLGLLPSDTYKSGIETAYKNYISNFITTDNNIINTCASAGLGGGSVKISSAEDDYKSGGRKYRNGTADYYTRGYDVTKITSYQEGKPLGAFILASTEYERFMKADYAPSFTAEYAEIPTAQTVTKGQSVTLHAATMAKPLAKYQWYSYPASDTQASKAKRAATTGTAIPGATSSDLTVTPEADTYYYCEATNDKGSATTEPVLLTVSEGGNEGTNTPTKTEVTEVVTFPNKTLTYEMTPADATKIEVNASGIVDKNEYLLSGYTACVKMDSGGSLSLNIPDGATNINVTLLSSSSVTSLKLNGNTNSTTWTGNDTDGYTYKFNIDNSLSGSTYTIYKGKGTSYINKITITYSLGSSTETPTGHTITYNLNGHGDAIAEVTNATALPEELPTPTADGYTFGGWYTDEALTKEATAGTGISDDITLYAKWTINKYNVTTTAQYGSIAIEDGDGSPIQPNTEVPYGTKLVFTATAKSGYKFSSWTVTGTIGTENSNVYTIESLDAETSVRANFTETSSAIYSYKVKSGETAPGINTSKYITDNNKNKLVKMTFGGWKWGTNPDQNNHTYTMPNKDKPLTDSWSGAETEGVDKLDGYDYWFSGGQDAVDESRASNGIIYGTERFGWFKTQTTDAANNVTTYPFTLPVRGAYMTFEPTENGWLTIYILQNGAWNSDTNKGIEIKPGEFRMHSFFITNQRGLTVQDFAPGMYSYEVNQKVATGYSCSEYDESKKPAVMDTSKKDISYWPEFWTLDAKERKAVHDHWANGTGGSETVIELSNGSFLLIQKAVIKYRFHVTGSETYYFFSNFSKMGFAGAEFQPDNAQPTAELTLTDTEKYTAPTAGTDGKVDNVTIPQYRSITFTRTFKPNQWTTLTLPFNLTQDEVQKIFGDGTQIIMLDKATLSSDGGARLHFIYHEIQNVLPGYPYLIKPTLKNIENDAVVDIDKDAPDADADEDNTPLTSFTVYGKCINPSIKPFEVNTTPYTFKGTPGYCTPDATGKTGYSVQYYENDIFVSEGDGKLYVSGGSSYGKGYRAWLKNKNNSTNAVKSISVVMSSFSDDDDTTTSIDVAEMAPDLIEALGIQTGVYNLSGQRVANDTRNLKAGIYIVNGKKTVVR